MVCLDMQGGAQLECVFNVAKMAWAVTRDGERIATWVCFGDGGWDLTTRRELVAEELDALMQFDCELGGTLNFRAADAAYRRRLREKRRAKQTQTSAEPEAQEPVGWLERLYELPDDRDGSEALHGRGGRGSNGVLSVYGHAALREGARCPHPGAARKDA